VKRRRTVPGRKSERGVVILLVAVVLLFIVVAMAALAIDLTTFYTARSEAQIAADGAALAGARVLANSGTTSDPTDSPLVDVEPLATTIATQVARHNEVGGRNLYDAEVSVSFPNAANGTGYNPQIQVRVTRSDLPTFFARIWGRSTITVSATATAEAYNPSGPNASVSGIVPIAPTCVKPWLLPNMYDSGNRIFDQDTGAILAPAGFLGQSVPIPSTSTTGGLYATCGSTACALPQTAKAWQYFPGKASSFPTPTQALPACSAGFNDPVVGDYQKSIAGCVQTPIVCGQNGNVDLYTLYSDPNPDQTAAAAVNCLTHSQNNNGDSMVTVPGQPSQFLQPFQFLAGADNPVVKPALSTVIVSDSLVTVPVVNVSAQFDRRCP
jgi:Flp pilus assembly protein TadG